MQCMHDFFTLEMHMHAKADLSSHFKEEGHVFYQMFPKPTIERLCGKTNNLLDVKLRPFGLTQLSTDFPTARYKRLFSPHT